jgi:O-antigen/teichoic acid export membrane protein
VIAHYLGADAVAQFAVPMKLFAVIPMLLGFVVTPLWPAYGEAIARGELAWVRRSYRRLLGLVLAVAIPLAGALVVAAPWVIARWVGAAIAVSPLLLVGLGLWAVTSSVTNAFAILLNGAHVVGVQVASATAMAVANVALSIVLVRRIGIAGPVYGSLAAVLLFTVVPCLLYIPRIFASHKPAQSTPTDPRDAG